jgi:nucleotide-binding universal stress UspA family protein
MLERIVVGVDGSEAAWHALKTAAELASICRAQLRVVSVEEQLPAYAATVGEVHEEARFKTAYFEKVQNEALLSVRAVGVPVDGVILSGNAAQVLGKAAEEWGSSLLVVGYRGHSKLHHLFLGSTADRVVEHAPCPVLVVR